MTRTVLFVFIFLLYGFTLTSCSSPNIKYRTGNSSDCIKDSCTSAFIERHNTPEENYDLAFVEFTERGNIFDRKKLNSILDYIKKEEKKKGVTLLVYVHGWKHNASNAKDGDVRKFRKLLKIISQNKVQDRKVIGVYVGWRGLTLEVEPFKTLTYWGRKNVARQVGSGGVSELLLRLKKIVSNGEESSTRNVYVVAGHSFGAAIISSAMKDIFLSKIVDVKKLPATQCETKSKFKDYCRLGCYKTKSFGDGVILVNPAIEANEFVQLKELSTEQKCYAREQPKLLHILSSDSDTATKYAFKPGQFLGVSIRESETKLEREVYSVGKEQERKILLDEYRLDTTTIGNYAPFRTGRSKDRDKVTPSERKFCKDKVGHLSECFIPCYGEGDCVSEKNKSQNFPVSPFEPLSIVYTDAEFMKNHTDIFNESVTGYMASAVISSQFKKDKNIYNKQIAQCFKTKKGKLEFDFSGCLNLFRNKYKADFCSEFNRKNC